MLVVKVGEVPPHLTGGGGGGREQRQICRLCARDSTSGKVVVLCRRGTAGTGAGGGGRAGCVGLIFAPCGHNPVTGSLPVVEAAGGQ